MSRRLDELSERREQQLLDLGRLTLEMHRRDEIDTSLLMERAGEIAGIEKELGQLQVALEQGESHPQSAGE
jgi:hypothetical protein